MPRRSLVAPAIAVLALACIASCTTSERTAGPTTTRRPGAPVTTADDVENPTSSLGDREMPGASDDCVAADRAYRTVLSATTRVLSPAATRADVDRLEREVEAVVAQAPPEIQPDVATWARIYADFAQGFNEAFGGGRGGVERSDKMKQALDKLQGPEFEQATDRINDYLARQCGAR